MSVSQERRCSRGGGYRIQAKSYNPRVALARSRRLLLVVRSLLCLLSTDFGLGEEMKKLRMISFAALSVLMAAMTAVAQPANQAAESAPCYKGYVAIAAGVGFAIPVFGGAIGQSRIGAAA